MYNFRNTKNLYTIQFIAESKKLETFLRSNTEIKLLRLSSTDKNYLKLCLIKF